MLTLLSEAGRSALRAFAGSVLILAPGVLQAPDLDQAKLLGVAALIAGFAAALKAVQVFVPQLKVNAGKYTDIVNSFVRAFLATFITMDLGVLNTPVQSWDKAALTGVLVAAVTAGLRAVQGFFTPGEFPSPQSGFTVNGQ